MRQTVFINSAEYLRSGYLGETAYHYTEKSARWFLRKDKGWRCFKCVVSGRTLPDLNPTTGFGDLTLHFVDEI